MSARLLLFVSLLLGSALLASAAPRGYQFRPTTNDMVFADFDGNDWGPWTATGDAFGSGPARGTLPAQQPVTGYQGRGLINTFVQGDKSTGQLVSPPFAIKLPYLNFLIGGGNHPGEVCINL